MIERAVMRQSWMRGTNRTSRKQVNGSKRRLNHV